MVGRREENSNGASLHAPLLGEDVGGQREKEEKGDSRGENGSYHGAVVVTVGDEDQQGYERSDSGRSVQSSSGGQGEQSEMIYDTPELATQSRNTFAQIRELSKQRSGDFLRRGGEEPVSRSKRRRHAVRNPIHKKSFVARAAYSFKTDTLNFLYNVLIGLYMWPKWSWDSMKANKSLTVLSVKQGAWFSYHKRANWLSLQL